MTKLAGVLLVSEDGISARSLRPFIDKLLERMKDLKVSIVVTTEEPIDVEELTR